METLKNFLAICFATITIMATIAIPTSIIFVLNEGFDIFGLLLIFAVVAFFILCMLVVKHNLRVQVALEMPQLFIP